MTSFSGIKKNKYGEKRNSPKIRPSNVSGFGKIVSASCKRLLKETHELPLLLIKVSVMDHCLIPAAYKGGFRKEARSRDSSAGSEYAHIKVSWVDNRSPILVA
jgi:hypothetical protein